MDKKKQLSARFEDLGKLGLNEIILTMECIFWGTSEKGTLHLTSPA